MAKTKTQGTFEDVSDDYKEFVGKFKAKKTTDDCYTPDNVYAVVLEWAAKKYGFDKANAVRPFWPGGDYQRETYPDGCVVVDNPPFSILSKIARWYNENGVMFFMFGPALTIFSGTDGKTNYVTCGASITYENGAVVSTSFMTNMGECLIETAPDLRDLITDANEENERKLRKSLPKYSYPPCVVTAAAMNYLSVHHTDFRLRRCDACFIRKLDAQTDTSLFGGGYLLSERAAAERAAATVWQLSERERQIQKMIGERSANNG